MKKLKLQVQMTVDGFVCGPNGELDWMTWDWDDKLKDHVNDLTASIDTILLGRKMTDGFVGHWTTVANDPKSPESSFGKVMVDTPKVVFSKTLNHSSWANTTLAKGNLADEVNKLKRQNGKDLMVYGGAGFNGALVQAGLIDEFNLFINPVAIGNGLSIFMNLPGKQDFKLVNTIPFECGVVLHQYILN